MVIDELRDASETLEAAANDCDDDDLRERLATQADALASLATRDQGPDHGRLARHTHALQDIASDADDDDIAAAVDDALASIRAYRETVSGV
ncbi:DUF7553 family protein [Halarchaeum nitratireducens]|uniref:Uncharacterized protein n=1 Tax=Halarchaeum nitratireducens TaxID=489913 RepID=A0A830G9T6_9EURY|nr:MULTISPECIES: hypothetical protein [Halarchaeum]MBP2250110.1 hypothetical protein [Halarchaeum solikamskense]GGN11228.1 hypothetical protein GCM10009021_08940 [Halarchaeum nitratireducens]